MRFIISRMSNKQAPPVETAREVGRTEFGDPVYGVDANTIEELMSFITRARSSSPGNVGLILWKQAPPAMSLPPELEQIPAIEIYDDIIA
jgi:hypothetical protein